MNLAENLKADTIARLRPTAALTIAAECTLADAVQSMKQKRVGCILICEQKKLVGIFTERDLLERVFAVNRPMTDRVAVVMTPRPDTVTMHDSIRHAIAQMEKGGHRHLPVVDESDRPVGMLSVKRLVHYLAEHFPTTVYNLPPDRTTYPLHRGGA